MATVTSQLTRIHDLEGSLVSVAVGGGAGAAANTDIFLQGSQSLGRRQSNVVVNGFLLDDGAGNDLSADNVHVGAWVWMTHYSALTALRFRVASASASTNYDEHTFPLTEFPSLGGWVRIWVDISRTPDFTGGTGLDEASARYFGPTVSLPTVGGNAANLILDAIDQTTTGLLLTGTSGVWQDFLTADVSTTNKYGVVSESSGIIYCRARLTLGSATSLAFSDSNFVVVFPQQNLVSSNFMGVTCSLANASTSITMTSGAFQSPGVVKGDFIVTGTSGTLTLTSCTLSGLRAVTLTSTCTATNTTFQSCGLVTQGAATISTCTFNAPSGAVGLLSGAPTSVTDCRFISKGTGHAIELTTPGTYTFDGNIFTGFAGTNGSTGNEAVYNNSGGAITLNITGGGSTPSIRNGAGASTTVNSNVSITLTGLKNPSEVRVFSAGTTTEVTGTGAENVTSGSHLFSVASGASIDIAVLSLGYQNLRILNFSTTADTSIPVSQQIDRQYNNP